MVTRPAAALDPARKAALARKLTDVLIAMEGGAFRISPRRCLVHVTVPEGYMDATRKSEVHEAANAAIIEVMGGPDTPRIGASVLVVIDEVIEGDWGAAGRTISLASIADTVGRPKTGDRFAWVSAYFDAKARQYASAGYPARARGILAPLHRS